MVSGTNRTNGPFRKILFFALCLLRVFNLAAQPTGSVPHLIQKGNYRQLIVNNKPFIIAGGELGNSSASSTEFMAPVWLKLSKLNLNTVIAPVYWELMEPAEGQFDLKLVDYLITSARKNNLKLVLLWFGTWKNSMSCYVPGWIKTNQQRFPRTEKSTGQTEEIITPFSDNALEADKKAFLKLLRHLKEMDSKEQTVIMIQVENEIGMIPDARDHSAAANAFFNKLVPADLIGYLNANKNLLLQK